MEENIIYMLWTEAEEKKKKFKIWKRIYNWLDRDNLGSIVLDGKVFWFELNSSSLMPNYIRDYLIKWGEGKGYTYLYNLPDKLKGRKLNEIKSSACATNCQMVSRYR